MSSQQMQLNTDIDDWKHIENYRSRAYLGWIKISLIDIAERIT